VIPNVLPQTRTGAAASVVADVATVLPWTLYLSYGDRRILEEQYPSMKAWWNTFGARQETSSLEGGHSFGDWLAYSTTDADYPEPPPTRT